MSSQGIVYNKKKPPLELSKTFCLRFSLNKGKSLYIYSIVRTATAQNSNKSFRPIERLAEKVKFSSVSLGSSPPSYLFTSATVRKPVHTTLKRDTSKPIGRVTLCSQNRHSAAVLYLWTEVLSVMIKLSGFVRTKPKNLIFLEQWLIHNYQWLTCYILLDVSNCT